jgi:hypothetical protein
MAINLHPRIEFSLLRIKLETMCDQRTTELRILEFILSSKRSSDKRRALDLATAKWITIKNFLQQQFVVPRQLDFYNPCNTLLDYLSLNKDK